MGPRLRWVHRIIESVESPTLVSHPPLSVDSTRDEDDLSNLDTGCLHVAVLARRVRWRVVVPVAVGSGVVV
jgi:hypothetical protein